MPSYPGRELFKGQIIHSAEYSTSDAWAGKRGVIVGAANSAHDVAEDMLDAGLSSVTMIQRNPTWVLPIAYYKAGTDPIYNDHIPTEIADRVQFALPIAVRRLITNVAIHSAAAQDDEYFGALERAGFKLERYGDLFNMLYERLGGHHLDVGAAARVVDGSIKMKSDAAILKYTPTGLEFDDGSTLDADVIVYTTGFDGSLRRTVSEIVGNEIGDKLEDWWGTDAEGEVRGSWKPIGHPNIWYNGGDIGNARFFCRFLAMQIKADLDGSPFEPYLETP